MMSHFVYEIKSKVSGSIFGAVALESVGIEDFTAIIIFPEIELFGTIVLKNMRKNSPLKHGKDDMLE